MSAYGILCIRVPLWVKCRLTEETPITAAVPKRTAAALLVGCRKSGVFRLHRKQTKDAVVGLVVCIMLAGVVLAIAILAAGVSPSADPNALGPPP